MSYLTAVADVELMAKLRKFELLPESIRVNAASRIAELAVETPDAGFLAEAVAPLLTADEQRSILIAVREGLLPNVSKFVDDCRGNFDGSDDPESHFYELKYALERYRDAFADDQEAADGFEQGVDEVNSAVRQLREGLPDRDDRDEDRFDGGSRQSSSGERSVFDDVDDVP